MKIKALSFLAILMASVVNPAAATVYIEDFEASFPTWESGWLGANTNLQNYYGVGAGRGNNPDGLWVDDGDGICCNTDTSVDINFVSELGSTISAFEMDIATWVGDLVLSVFDMANNLVYSSAISATFGAYTDPGNYIHVSTTSSNGISRFSFSGNYVEGNTSIDNVKVTTGGSVGVPEPGMLGLMLVGLLGFIAARKRA